VGYSDSSSNLDEEFWNALTERILVDLISSITIPLRGKFGRASNRNTYDIHVRDADEWAGGPLTGMGQRRVGSVFT
jgi:hypothetical protein